MPAITPHEHYLEAQEYLSAARDHALDEEIVPVLLAFAQAHATLATVSQTVAISQPTFGGR